MIDLDQGGSGNLSTLTSLGPSLGNVRTLIKPQKSILAAGAYVVAPGDSVILINIAGLVTVNLPSVALWVKETAYQPATGFERMILVKDYGGHADSFPIVITPFGSDLIDNSNSNLQMNSKNQAVRLYPLFDLTGWYSG